MSSQNKNEVDVLIHKNALMFIDVNEDSIQNTCDLILQQEGLQECILSVVLCDDAFIQPLNRDYRGKDKATDVLSFSQREGDFADPNDPLLGDIIISLETTLRQSQEHNQTPIEELELLLTHGILHLLGYDHIEDDEAEIMEAREQCILTYIRNQNKNEE